MDYSPPGSSVHGILQARILGWVATSYSRGYSQPRDWRAGSLPVMPPGKPSWQVNVQWNPMWHYRLWNQTDLDHNSSITIYHLWVILQSNLSASRPAYLWKWAKEYLPLGSVERIKWIKKAHPCSFLGYSRHSEQYHISSTLSYSFSWFKSSESSACFQSLTSWNCNWWYFVLFLRGNNIETRLGSNGIWESIKYGGSWSSSFK